MEKKLLILSRHYKIFILHLFVLKVVLLLNLNSFETPPKKDKEGKIKKKRNHQYFFLPAHYLCLKICFVLLALFPQPLRTSLYLFFMFVVIPMSKQHTCNRKKNRILKQTRTYVRIRKFFNSLMHIIL